MMATQHSSLHQLHPGLCDMDRPIPPAAEPLKGIVGWDGGWYPQVVYLWVPAIRLQRGIAHDRARSGLRATSAGCRTGHCMGRRGVFVLLSGARVHPEHECGFLPVGIPRKAHGPIEFKV